MKKFFLYIIFLMGITPAINTANLPGPAGQPELQLPPLTDEQWNAFSELLNNMSEEELEFYAKLGEEYINEEIKQGRDPYAIFNEAFETPPTPEEKPVITPEQQKPVVDKKTEIDLEQKIVAAQLFLKNLEKILTAIKQTAENNRKSKQALEVWQYHIEDLIYFAHTIDNTKLLRYFASKDFEELYNAFKELNEQLSMLEPLFQIPDMDMEDKNPYTVLKISPYAPFTEIQHTYQDLMRQNKPDFIKKNITADMDLEKALDKASKKREAITAAYTSLVTQEQAKQALQGIIEALDKAIYKNTIITAAKKLVAAYEPEALAIKEQQEKKEAAARKEQEEAIKRTPRFSGPLFDGSKNEGNAYYPSIPQDYTSPTSYNPYTPQPSSSQESPLSPTTPTTPSSDKKYIKKDEKKDDKKKTPENKDDKKKAPENKNISQKTIEVKLRLQDLTNFLENGNSMLSDKPVNLFKDFSTYLQTPWNNETEDSITKAKDINTALTEMTSHIVNIKKELRNVQKFNANEKRDVKKAYKKIFADYKKETLDKTIKDLLTLPLTVDNTLLMPDGQNKAIAPEKLYVHMGINTLRDLQEDIPETLVDLNADNINFLKLFMDAYTTMMQETKEEPQKTPVKGNLPSIMQPSRPIVAPQKTTK